MKKHLCLFVLLLLVLALPCALADTTVPQEVLDLCATAHPGYTVAAADGAAGQYALVLTNSSENRLCIAEREAGGDYALTIDNPTALRQGADIPELLIDTAGDVLFYTYHGGEYSQDTVYTYHAVKQDGAWGTVNVTVRYNNDEYAAWVQDGKLHRSVSYFDKEDNLLDQDIYLPLPLAGMDDQLTLADFDISLLPTGEYADPPEAMIRAALGLPEDTTLESVRHSPNLFAQYTAADGTHYIAACSYDEQEGYRISRSQPLSDGWDLDEIHSWSSPLISDNNQDVIYSFGLDRNGAWLLSVVQIPGEIFCVFPNAIMPSDGGNILYAGDLPAFDLSTVALDDLPKSQAEAFAAMDSTNWRLVNNPIATDRLRLRDAPGGKELGRYYNGTPVLVLGEEGEWSHVRIGHVEGYMMTAYLAPGDQGVEVRGVQLAVREELVGQDIPLYTQPDESSAVVAQVKNPDYMPQSGELFCGTAGDGWIHVLLLHEGISGYIQEKYLWAGNG